MFDKERFLNYVLYIAYKLKSTRNFLTTTKLYKILWFASLKLADKYGMLLLQDVFIKQKYGPVPDLGGRYIQSIIENQGLNDGEIKIEIQHQTGINNKQYTYNIIEPFDESKHYNEDLFSDVEKEVLDEAIMEYGHLTVKELSTLSHKDAWAEVDLFKTINITTDMKNRDNKEIVFEQYSDLVKMIQKIKYAL